jgi:hypothetical protein
VGREMGQTSRASELMRRARSIDSLSAALLYYEAVVHVVAGRPEAGADGPRASARGVLGEGGSGRPRTRATLEVGRIYETDASLFEGTHLR